MGAVFEGAVFFLHGHQREPMLPGRVRQNLHPPPGGFPAAVVEATKELGNVTGVQCLKKTANEQMMGNHDILEESILKKTSTCES